MWHDGDDDDDDAKAKQGPDKSDLGEEIGVRIGEGHDPIEDEIL